VFHAGTKRDAAGRVVTDGGRVLGVTALGADLPAAVARAYEAVAQIHFDGVQYRRDIARRALAGR
jgi:phosphoribosylamine--glycine ligase